MEDINIKDLFHFLTNDQFDSMRLFISKNSDKNFLLEELADYTNMDNDKALAVLVILKNLEYLTNFLRAHHVCEDGYFGGGYYLLYSSPIENGLPELPIYCDNCDAEIQTHEQLYYDILSVKRK